MAKTKAAPQADPAPVRTRADIAADLAAAREHSAAVADQLADIAARESDALQESDTAFASWLREQRLAANEAIKAAADIEALEAEDERAIERDELEQFDRLYRATAARSEELVERFKKDVPEAWRLLASMMRAVAELEADREILRRTMPANYEPEVRIASVETETRSPGSSSHGGRFVPASNFPAFATQLRFPSFDGLRAEPIFDGERTGNDAHSILKALDAADLRAPRK